MISYFAVFVAAFFLRAAQRLFIASDIFLRPSALSLRLFFATGLRDGFGPGFFLGRSPASKFRAACSLPISLSISIRI
jgi:hypothetical protein